jgi:hypothetical protein
MPMVQMIWSAFFWRTSMFAKKSHKTSFVGFVREFELWRRHWDNQPRPEPGATLEKGTLKIPVPSTRQQELDELLFLAVKTCAEKSMMLLAAGASPNARGHHSRKYAVSYVAIVRRGDAEILQKFIGLLREFISKGVDIRVTDVALKNAAKHSLDMVKLLVEAGVVIDGDCDRFGLNALGTAVAAGKEDIVEYLVKNGADINLKDPHQKLAAVHHVRCTRADCGEKRAYPYTLALYPPPPAMFMSCNESMLKKLASLGADLNVPCVNKRACARGVEEYKALLIHERRLAVAMGLNSVFGRVSLVLTLDEELVRMVLDVGSGSTVLS